APPAPRARRCRSRPVSPVPSIGRSCLSFPFRRFHSCAAGPSGGCPKTERMRDACKGRQAPPWPRSPRPPSPAHWPNRSLIEAKCRKEVGIRCSPGHSLVGGRRASATCLTSPRPGGELFLRIFVLTTHRRAEEPGKPDQEDDETDDRGDQLLPAEALA